jgi:hypothetical protein
MTVIREGTRLCQPPVVTPRVLAVPLALFERDGLKAALKKAGLPSDDVLFSRFETQDAVPVGFGGLEIYEMTSRLTMAAGAIWIALGSLRTLPWRRFSDAMPCYGRS